MAVIDYSVLIDVRRFPSLFAVLSGAFSPFSPHLYT